ncbi:hypothetical protein Sste5346_005545 [Sporothrix stenoceras]|uniref:DUF7136 domain-containing protein n=1 Tax=Sporothrix stenoceras TaxID=5173 RepID=A0ABR3Z2S7_9PEZI
MGETITDVGDSFTPGHVNLNLVFPLNETYAVLDAPLPIVFSVNRPDLATLLQLQLNYTLLYADNYATEFGFSEVIDFGNGSTPALTTSSLTNGTDMFFVHYAPDLVNKTGHFMVACSMYYILGVVLGGVYGDEPVVLGYPSFYNAYFSLGAGGAPAVVPSMSTSNSMNATDCVDHASWSMHFDIIDSTVQNGTTYAVIDGQSYLFGPLQCGAEVDPATAANISAATASGGSATTPTQSPSSSSATNAAGPAVMPRSTAHVMGIAVLVMVFSVAFIGEGVLVVL